MKTHQVAYLEDVNTLKWMQKNVPKLEQSKFIREATANKIKKVDKKKNK